MTYTTPFPVDVSLSLCKRKFEYTYALREAPLEEYLPLETAVLNYRGKRFFRKLLSTKSFYAFRVNEGEVYVHPDGYYKSICRIERRKIIERFLSGQDPLH